MSVDLISPLSIRPARTVPAVPARRVAADLLQLTKPTLTAMNVLVMLGAYALAGGGFDPVRLLALLGGTTLIVGSANAMNQVLEQDTDALMARTRNRPLPAGRMDAGAAATFGFVTLLASLPPLWVVDPGAAALGVGAWLAYVCVYTPMKRRSGWALLVGAVPGAVPPLMGWVAAGGALALEAWLLFAVLVAWQVPHFIGVALLSGDDYARAGIVTIVADRGDRGARVRAGAWSWALLVASLALAATPLAWGVYAVVAVALGLYVCRAAGALLRPGAGRDVTRRFFFAALAYLPALVLALVLDAALL